MEKVEGKNFTALQVGEFQALDQVNERGKLFLKEELNLTGMEVSLNKLGPGKESPFLHQHKNNEELYIFVKGSGQYQVDGEVIPVREGTVIRVAPAGVRALRNTSSSEDLYYIAIQAAENSLTTWTGTDGIKLDDPITWPGA